MINYIKLGFKFLFGILGIKKKEYILTFQKEDNNLWYIDMPWPGNHDNLQMVGGSNRLLDFLKDRRVTVSVIPASKEETHEGYFKLRKTFSRLTGGATYAVENLSGFTEEIWICPVTLTVLGKYPNFIYCKKLS